MNATNERVFGRRTPRSLVLIFNNIYIVDRNSTEKSLPRFHETMIWYWEESKSNFLIDSKIRNFERFKNIWKRFFFSFVSFFSSFIRKYYIRNFNKSRFLIIFQKQVNDSIAFFSSKEIKFLSSFYFFFHYLFRIIIDEETPLVILLTQRLDSKRKVNFLILLSLHFFFFSPHFYPLLLLLMWLFY